MTLKKYLFTVLVLAFLVISLPHLRSVFADWITDLDPPGTTFTLAEYNPANGIDRCKTVGTTTTCPAKTESGADTQVIITFTCTDVGPSGCNSVYHREADSGAFTQVTPYNISSPPQVIIPSGGFVNKNIYAYSVDNAGNSEQANTKMQTISFVYFISGNVFVDPDGDGKKELGENNYTGAITIKAVRQNDATVPKQTVASYVCSSSCAGYYTLTVPDLAVAGDRYIVTFENFADISSTYDQTEPSAGIPPALTVRTGNPCIESSQNASCTAANNIIGLDFGIKEKITGEPWFQCIGADCRKDDIFDDHLPNGQACGSNDYPSEYASIPDPNSGLVPADRTPGIIFSGGTLNFGTGDASAKGWKVGGISFSPVRPKVIRTSYKYYTAALTQNGITPTNLATLPTQCTDNGDHYTCTFSSGFPNGIYTTTNKNVEINASTFTGNKDYVFLIDGNLTINGNIRVDTGSTATFSVKNDIIVKGTVGGNATTACNITDHTGCHVEGYYSADHDFKVEASNLRLNVAGAIVVNANKEDDNGTPATVGTFSYLNDLTSNNSKCPAFTLTERPDFLLNAPEFIKHSTFTWQEVAP